MSGSNVTYLIGAPVIFFLFIHFYFGPFLSLSIIGVVFLSVYLFISYKFTYWRKKNVPFDPPEFPFGYFRKIMSRQTHFTTIFGSIYNNYPDEPFVGMYCCHKPALLIRDPDIIKAIMTTNSEDFSSRGILYNPTVDPYTFSILSVDTSDPKWKIVKSKADEAFTIGKIKTNMLKVMLESADSLNTWLKKSSTAGALVELNSVGNQYALDVIGEAAFGVHCRSFEESFNPYKELSTQLSVPKSLFGHMRLMSSLFVPELMVLLGLPFCGKRVTDFFEHWYDSIAEQRRTKKKKDWIGEMLDLLRKRQEGDTASYGTILTKEEHLGNMMAMVEAGYESSASVICVALYHLTLHPHMQEKARDEVRRVLNEHGGFTYEAILDMNYVGDIIDETFRLYTPVPIFFRKSTRNCKLPNTELTIERGTQIIIPTNAILRDPHFYPDPEVFDPDRKHTQLGKSLLSNFSFGWGPRLCPGKRYSLIEGRIVLAKVLSRFKLLPSERTPLKIEVDKRTFPLRPTPNAWVRVEELSSGDTCHNYT